MIRRHKNLSGSEKTGGFSSKLKESTRESVLRILDYNPSSGKYKRLREDVNDIKTEESATKQKTDRLYAKESEKFTEHPCNLEEYFKSKYCNVNKNKANKRSSDSISNPIPQEINEKVLKILNEKPNNKYQDKIHLDLCPDRLNNDCIDSFDKFMCCWDFLVTYCSELSLNPIKPLEFYYSLKSINESTQLLSKVMAALTSSFLKYLIAKLDITFEVFLCLDPEDQMNKWHRILSQILDWTKNSYKTNKKVANCKLLDCSEELISKFQECTIQTFCSNLTFDEKLNIISAIITKHYDSTDFVKTINKIADIECKLENCKYASEDTHSAYSLSDDNTPTHDIKNQCYELNFCFKDRMEKSKSRYYLGKIKYSTGEICEYFVYPSEPGIIFVRQKHSFNVYSWKYVVSLSNLSLALSYSSHPEFLSRLEAYQQYLSDNFKSKKTILYDLASPDIESICLENSRKYMKLRAKSKFQSQDELENFRDLIKNTEFLYKYLLKNS